MSGFDWFLVAWFIFDAFMLTLQVGKPRKPVEASTAAIAMVINAILIAGLLWTRGAS